MSWLNPALLFGLGLVALPIALHLLFRARPKRLPFPALRLVLARRQQNARRLRIRHWWLLLARMAVIGVAVLALARPMVPAVDLSFRVWELVGAVIIVALAVLADGVLAGWLWPHVARWRRSTRPDAAPGRSLLSGGAASLPLRGATRPAWAGASWLRHAVVLASAVLLLAIFVLWPWQGRIRAALADPRPLANQLSPVAAVLLFDNSMSMQYTQDGQTRLAAAQEMARRLLGQLPTGSRVGIMQTGDDLPVVLGADLLTAENRVATVALSPTQRVLEERLEAAVRAQQDDRQRTLSDQASIRTELQQDRFVREVYVLTDLSRSAWRPESPQQAMSFPEWLNLYVVDVGVEEPLNVGLARLDLGRDAVIDGAPARVGATLRAAGGSPRDVIVELTSAQADGTVRKLGQETLNVTPGEAAVVQFLVESPTRPVFQGQLRIVGSDPLDADDAMAVTLGVSEPINTLILADDPGDATVLQEALRGLTAGRKAAFTVDVVRPATLTDERLQQADVVLLVQVEAPTSRLWKQLEQFVGRGGGVLVCLGAPSVAVVDPEARRKIDPVAYEGGGAILPARPLASLRFSPAAALDVRGSGHLLGERLEQVGALAQLGIAEVRRYWSVEPHADARRVFDFNDERGSPAMLERVVGPGRVLMVTTALDSLAWNDLPESWAILALLDQSVQMLSRQTAQRWNWTVGDLAEWRGMPAEQPRELIFRQPDLRQAAIEWPAREPILPLARLSAIGNYQLVDSSSGGLIGGVSATLRAEECDLSRLTSDDLTARLGPDRAVLLRDISQLERKVSLGRLGQELSGLLLALLVAVFVIEQVSAVWFYRAKSDPLSVTRAA